MADDWDGLEEGDFDDAVGTGEFDSPLGNDDDFDFAAESGNDGDSFFQEDEPSGKQEEVKIEEPKPLETPINKAKAMAELSELETVSQKMQQLMSYTKLLIDNLTDASDIAEKSGQNISEINQEFYKICQKVDSLLTQYVEMTSISKNVSKDISKATHEMNQTIDSARDDIDVIYKKINTSLSVIAREVESKISNITSNLDSEMIVRNINTALNDNIKRLSIDKFSKWVDKLVSLEVELSDTIKKLNGDDSIVIQLNKKIKQLDENTQKINVRFNKLAIFFSVLVTFSVTSCGTFYLTKSLQEKQTQETILSSIHSLAIENAQKHNEKIKSLDQSCQNYNSFIKRIGNKGVEFGVFEDTQKQYMAMPLNTQVYKNNEKIIIELNGK